MGKSRKWGYGSTSEGGSSSSSIDRISNLPSSLITRILSLLPTKCAVATSVLSTKWKYLWTSITSLDFDDTDNFPKKSLNVRRIKFTKYVNKVLLLLNPPYIEDFYFKCKQQLSDPFYLDLWISAAIGRTIGELDLDFSFTSHELKELPFSQVSCNVKVLKLNGDIFFNIPSQASVCFPNLEDLYFTRITVEISRTSELSFPKLKNVQLNNVNYENEDSANQLLSSCPVLEDLYIKREDWDNVLCLIICIPSLTQLELDWSFDDDNMYQLQMDKLDNLVYLYIWGRALKAIMNSPMNISSTFQSVTHLELEKEDCHGWLALLKQFLEGMDNLEHLTVTVHSCSDCDPSCWNDWCSVPKCLLSRVTTIYFTYNIDYVGCGDLELFRYILKNAEVLELLTISTNEFTPVEKLEFVEKMSMFPRGSRMCQVAFP